MNATPAPTQGAEATEVAVIPRETALSVLTDDQQFDAFYKRIKAEVDAHVADVTTQKGRDAIKSLAFKVVKTKTAIDEAGKKLTEEWRKNTATVDASRKKIRDQLDALRDEVRKPVVEWEAAEQKRQLEVSGAFARLQADAVVSIGDSLEDVTERLRLVRQLAITDEQFQDMAQSARTLRDATVATLEAAVERLTQEAADRAELERLRKQDEERQAAEAAAAAARAEQERQAREAQEAEARAKLEAEAQAQREREAAERAATEAADAARREAQEAARAEQQRLEQAHQQQLAQAQAQRDAAEAEAQRLADEKAAEDAKAAEAQAAAAKRARNIAHKGKIMGEAKAAIMAAGGVGEEAAKKIVLAIAAGTVPHTTISF